MDVSNRFGHFYDGKLINDDMLIDYEGEEGRKQFALTITARKLYRDLHEFRRDLYAFLKEIGYKFKIKAVMEYHEKSFKVHCHGIAFGSPAIKGNRFNPFTLRTSPIDNIKGWVDYCIKSNEHTFEKFHENYIVKFE